MKYYDWSEEKNKWLKSEREISFEDVVIAIDDGRLLDIQKNKNKYSHQKMYLVNIREYVYRVPFVEDEEKIFLKTIIPDRKATKKYLKKKGK